MRLQNIRSSYSENQSRFEATIERASGESADLYFEFDVPDLAVPADSFAAAMLLAAMHANEPLIVEPRISQRLHQQLPRIMQLFHRWFPEFSLTEIKTAPAAKPATGGPGAATFFSGGVDSFYTMLKHVSGEGPLDLTDIIFMRGIETPLPESDPGVSVSEKLIRETATAKGLNLITGETNIRTVLCPSGGPIHWEKHYHGSALAAIALALKPLFHAVCIPSAFTYSHLIPHGSSPVLDEMYSTEAVAIMHDGAEADRAMKVERIIGWDKPLVLDQLRVCMGNAGSAFNCGECKKCVRTSIPLAALGVLEDAKLFNAYHPEKWARITSWDHEALVEENRRFVLKHGADPELMRLLRKSQKLRRAAKRRQAIRMLAGPVAPPLEKVLHSVRRNAAS